MSKIDRDSPVPIYHQLKTLILDQIASGLWRPGDQIPSESELCRLYGISRAPVRQALKELEYEGVLIRRSGSGTFVNRYVSPTPQSVPIQMMCSDSHWEDFLRHVEQEWNTAHPQKTISFRVEVVAHTQFYDLLSAAVGRGAAPDVAMVDCVWVAGLAKSGFLYPLEDLSAPNNHPDFGKDLYPAFVAANSYRGHLYGLPVKADLAVLWYRRDWFEKEGLAPPTHWDELVEVVRHFLQPAVQRQYGYVYPLAFPGGTAGGEATVYTLLPFIWSAGGEIFAGGEIVLDSPATRRALQFLRDLVVTHQAAPPQVTQYREDTAPFLFATGKVAMALGGSYEGDLIRRASDWMDGVFEEKVGFVLPPFAPGGAAAPTIGGTSYVFLRQSPRPQEVMEVFRFATDPQRVSRYYREMLQILPRPSFNQLVAADTEPLLAWVAEKIAQGRARPSIPDYARVSRQLQRMFEATISETTPVEQITRRTAERIAVITDLACREVS